MKWKEWHKTKKNSCRDKAQPLGGDDEEDDDDDSGLEHVNESD